MIFMNATKTAKFCDDNGALFHAVLMTLHACFMSFVTTYIVLMNGHGEMVAMECLVYALQVQTMPMQQARMRLPKMHKGG
jgi:hypothetical protein